MIFIPWPFQEAPASTDILAISYMPAHVTEKVSILHKLCQENGFKLGSSKSQAYAQAWEEQSGKGGLPPEGVDSETHLRTLNEAADMAKQFLLALGWSDSQLSPFIRKYSTFADLAQVLENVYAKVGSDSLNDFTDFFFFRYDVTQLAYVFHAILFLQERLQ